MGDSIKEEDIKASFNNGILELTFPKEVPQKEEEMNRVALGEGMEDPHPFPIPCLMHLFHLAVAAFYLFFPLGLKLWNLEVPRLRVKLELQKRSKML